MFPQYAVIIMPENDNVPKSDRERAIELFELISQTRKAIPCLPGWEAELDALLPGDGGKKPTKRRTMKPRRASAKPTEDATNSRDGVTATIRACLDSMPAEFTSRELLKCAGITTDQEPTAFAAVSRMKANKEIVKSPTTPGKYRLGTPRHRAISGIRAAVTNVMPTHQSLPDRILSLFASEPKHEFDAPDIGKRFGLSTRPEVNSIGGALSRLNADGLIEKVSRGKYKAKEGGR
jgi:hypothetical protein